MAESQKAARSAREINFRRAAQQVSKKMCFFFPDFGLEILSQWVARTNFPWLMSNVIDNETGRPLGDGKITHVIDWNGKRIGLVSQKKRRRNCTYCFLSFPRAFCNYFLHSLVVLGCTASSVRKVLPLPWS